MSSLRGMRHLLRPRREPPPPEEPRLPRVGTEPRLVGLPLHKMPEDLRVYEHLLWAGCVDTVIELGSGAGGSALWFHDRLRGFQEQGRSAGAAVISVDIDVSGARANVGERRDIRFVVSTPTGADFELRRDVEAYGLTSNSGGYLRRMG